MLKKILLPSILMILAYGFWISPDFKEISAGVAIFLFGMLTLEEGFKVFSGGILEKVLKQSTDKTWKSLSFGIISTTIMQSSSLVSVLTISFIGAGLIGLAQGIGIIFGANIGTTTGAWLVAGLGLKVKISAYAMPMLVFGVILIFQKAKSLKGIGYILAGLGFLFLGIHYMKDGFEAFKTAVDLSQYGMTGIKGLLVFTGLGILATVIMQSSHATLTLIIVSLASGQISYENALALAIGANVGTTITAIIGSLSSNIEGKRLAGAHLIFNLTTGLIAIVFMNQLISIVEWTSNIVGISENDYSLKLAVFHTYFNVIGVVVMTPFINKLVIFLEKVLKDKNKDSCEIISTPKFLNESILELSGTTLVAITNETKNLYNNAFEIISHGLNLKRSNILNHSIPIEEILKDPYSEKSVDIDQLYEHKIKGIYSAIVDYAVRSQKDMSPEAKNELYGLKVASRDIVEAVKDTKHLQKNMNKYLKSSNEYIRKEYDSIRKSLVDILRNIDLIINSPEQVDKNILISKIDTHIKKNDLIANGKLDELIRSNKITSKMATSLMNDSSYAYNIAQNLKEMAKVLYVKDELKLEEEELTSSQKSIKEDKQDEIEENS